MDEAVVAVAHPVQADLLPVDLLQAALPLQRRALLLPELLLAHPLVEPPLVVVAEDEEADAVVAEQW